MPVKSKGRGRKPAERKGSSTALYFSLGAVAAAVTAAVVTLLRRNLMARASQPRREIPPEGEPVAVPRPSPAEGPSPSESADPPPQQVVSPPSEPISDPGETPEAATPRMDTSWAPTTKYIVGVGLFLAVVSAVVISRGSIKTVVLAALIAFVVRPVIDGLSRRFKMKRGAATAIVYLLVVLLVILIPILVLPALVEAVNTISAALYERAAGSLVASIGALIQNLSNNPALGGALIPVLEAFSDVLTQVAAGGTPPPLVLSADQAVLTGALGVTLGSLAGILGPFISSIVSLVFALLISIQMSIAGDLFRDAGLNMVPAAFKPEISALMDKIGFIWNSFLRGELVLMLVVGVFVWFGNWLIGTPQALALGVIAGLLEVIPSLGPLLAWIPAFFLALVFGSTRFTGMDPLVFALLVSLMYGLIQALENQVLVPQILGDAVNLPPVVVLIGVTIFGSLFGIMGILIATPTISTLSEVFNYLYGKILEGPAPPPEEEKRSLMDNVRGFVGRIRPPWRRKSEQEPARLETPESPAE